jgi:hypothetical protein
MSEQFPFESAFRDPLPDEDPFETWAREAMTPDAFYLDQIRQDKELRELLDRVEENLQDPYAMGIIDGSNEKKEGIDDDFKINSLHPESAVSTWQPSEDLTQIIWSQDVSSSGFDIRLDDDVNISANKESELMRFDFVCSQLINR